jgi:hypothetical protein
MNTLSKANYLSSLFTCKPNFFFLTSELFDSSHLPEFLHCSATDLNLRLITVNVDIVRLPLLVVIQRQSDREAVLLPNAEQKS